MSAYRGRHAELYDLFYADKPYAREASFVDGCLRRFSHTAPRQLLELACGTGRHALEFERLGYEVTAVDLSQDMLQCAKERGQQASSRVDFRHGDMRALEFADASFDAVVCLFDSIGYVKSNESLKQLLAGVHRQLRGSGVFLFEFWHAAAMLRGYDPIRIRRWNTQQGQVLRISETTVDTARQLCRVDYTVYELNRDGSYQTLSETQHNRFFLVQEMANLLVAAGFEPVQWCAGFSETEEISADTWHVVAVARKHSASGKAAA